MERAIHTVKSAWAPRAIPPEPSRTHSIPNGILTASSLLRISTKMCCVSPCLTEISFHQMISWVVLKFQWQKFAQNRKAKAPQPADCCCMRSPLGRSGSALTCSFLSKKLSCRGLRDLPKRLGLEPDGRCCSWAEGAPHSFIHHRPHAPGLFYCTLNC